MVSKREENWDRFVSKAEDHFVRLDYAQTKYSPAMYDPVVSVKRMAKSTMLRLPRRLKDLTFIPVSIHLHLTILSEI